MRRAPFVITGTVLGTAGVMAVPSQGKPQQVVVTGNAATTAKTTAAKASTKTTSASSTATTTAKPAAAPAAATTVTGSLVTNQFSQLQVKLTVKSGKITNVGFTTFTANDGTSAQIDQSSVPTLITETIAAQSAHIQGVSGATYTTIAYEQSLQAAIDQATLHA